jgi:glutathione S-transferase
MYKLYVIPGSHACRSAMLMLEHKQIPYRRIEFVTLMHPTLARLNGFDAGGERRAAHGKRTPLIRFGDFLGTVPGLAAEGERVSTNRRIARFLDRIQREPPLFPADPAKRAAVEEVESWANGALQMTARLIILPAFMRDPATYAKRTADGRLGPLLYHRELTRRLVSPMIGRMVFASGQATDDDVVAGLPAMLDRIDAWIEAGVVGGERTNAADCMIAPSLALMLYRSDVQPLFDGRPALALVDRLLPEPVVSNAA